MKKPPILAFVAIVLALLSLFAAWDIKNSIVKKQKEEKYCLEKFYYYDGLCDGNYNNGNLKASQVALDSMEYFHERLILLHYE